MKTKNFFAACIHIMICGICLTTLSCSSNGGEKPTGDSDSKKGQDTTEVVKPEGEPAPIDTTKKFVEQVRECSALYTAQAHVHKIVKHTDEDTKVHVGIFGWEDDFTLPTGKRVIAIPVDGEIKASIDMANFSEENIERNGSKINVTLPDPEFEMSFYHINYDQIVKDVALFRKDFSPEEIESYNRQGRESIITAVTTDTDLVKRAQEGAAEMIIPIITALGYNEQDVTVSFRKGFSEEMTKNPFKYFPKEVG